MDPALSDIQRQEELLIALSRNPHSANPGFQGFLQSKLAELNAKKQTLDHSSSSESAISTKSETTQAANMRYHPNFDEVEKTSATTSVRASSTDSFTTTGELFEGLCPTRVETPAVEGKKKGLDESWDLKDLSRMVSEAQIPVQNCKFAPRGQTRAVGGSTPREQKLREMYEAEKARADAERIKTQETILAMKARLLQEKERHIEDMMQLMKAHSELQSPATRTTAAFFPAEAARSPGKTRTEPVSRSSLDSKAKAYVPSARPQVTSPLAQKSDPDDVDHPYIRMISNESEALRDEYEQNFESVLDSSETDKPLK
jgi:hypothetical protein